MGLHCQKKICSFCLVNADLIHKVRFQIALQFPEPAPFQFQDIALYFQYFYVTIIIELPLDFLFFCKHRQRGFVSTNENRIKQDQVLPTASIFSRAFCTMPPTNDFNYIGECGRRIKASENSCYPYQSCRQ